jgi:hypothetical protein
MGMLVGPLFPDAGTDAIFVSLDCGCVFRFRPILSWYPAANVNGFVESRSYRNSIVSYALRNEK